MMFGKLETIKFPYISYFSHCGDKKNQISKIKGGGAYFD